MKMSRYYGIYADSISKDCTNIDSLHAISECKKDKEPCDSPPFTGL